VPNVAAAVHHFPDRELEIHRLCARDPEFASDCEDFSDALAASARWEAIGTGGASRASEYRQIAGELAATILAALDAERRRRHLPGT
jgi:hypothetical protein